MTQRTWLITGVSSGFGRHMTEQLLARGDRVIGTVRKAGALQDLAEAHGDRLALHLLDVSDAAAVQQFVEAAFASHPRIDVIVSNAGYGLFGAAESFTDEQIRHQIDTNLVGSIQLVRSAISHLRAQGGGRVLQLSTYGGQAASPGGSLCHAGKWGIEGFIDAVGQEVAGFRIEATLVEPGGARTEFRYGSSRLGPWIEAYAGTPVAGIHKIIEEAKLLPIGDPARMVALMIASVDQHPAPKRLALGSDAYTAMHKALTTRLAELEAQRELAFSTDFPAGA
ncbi:SDR family oxidoreductase [Paucibacter sp. R3-3]|uniref:SDR family oxidoreductase n=1 Tax=Roseateles agri TaxID=3098619 RepID=A0ABU5DN95_9BURK|nr:SDR family oxidoreductase [Paucibacter sp. R3-3]MDY0747788.1 SDR family oxidoreductase [Paucibacter sp. R3-3]